MRRNQAAYQCIPRLLSDGNKSMAADGRGGIRRHQAIATTYEGWDPAAMTTSLLFLAAATPLHSSIIVRSTRR
jgi:hypothetical protein